VIQLFDDRRRHVVIILNTFCFELQRLVRALMCGRGRRFCAKDMPEVGLKIRPTMTSTGCLYTTPAMWSWTTPAGFITPLYQGYLKL